MHDDSVDSEMILEMGKRFCWEILVKMKPTGEEATHIRHALFALESYPEMLPSACIEISLSKNFGKESDDWTRRGCLDYNLQVTGDRIDLMVGGSSSGDSYTTFSASLGEDEHCNGDPKYFSDIFNEIEWDGYELAAENDAADKDDVGDGVEKWPINYFRRYPESLITAIRYKPECYENVLLCLSKLNDPLLAVASVAIIVRHELDYGETDYAQVASLLSGKTNCTDCDALDAAWESLSNATYPICKFYNELPILKGIIDSECDLGARFWKSAVPNEKFLAVLRNAFLSAIGKRVHVINLFLADRIKDLKPLDYNYDLIHFLMRCGKHGLDWLDEFWSDDQIRAFPGLIEYAAEIEMLGNIQVGEAGDTIDKLDVSRFLCADPGYGLKMICKHYPHAPRCEGITLDCLGDTLYEIEKGLPGKLLDQLKGIYHTSANDMIRKGAKMLMEDCCEYILDPEDSKEES